MYFEILSQLQPKSIEDEIEDLIDTTSMHTNNDGRYNYCLESSYVNPNMRFGKEIAYKNFVEMEDLEDTIDYLYYRQLMGYRRFTDINNTN